MTMNDDGRRGRAITLRDGMPADAETLVALYRDTVRNVNLRDYTAAQVAAWAPDEIPAAPWATRLAASNWTVAERDGVVVGFCELEADGLMRMLFVHKDHQGQGIATALLNRAEAQARAAGLARLYTEASLTARPVFERHGYAVIEAQSVTRGDQTLRNFRMEKPLT